MLLYAVYFICDFAYVNDSWPFSGTYPLIYSNPWSFYIQIRYMRAYFFGPYLSHITRDTCIQLVNLQDDLALNLFITVSIAANNSSKKVAAEKRPVYTLDV